MLRNKLIGLSFLLLPLAASASTCTDEATDGSGGFDADKFCACFKQHVTENCQAHHECVPFACGDVTKIIKAQKDTLATLYGGSIPKMCSKMKSCYLEPESACNTDTVTIANQNPDKPVPNWCV